MTKTFLQRLSRIADAKPIPLLAVAANVCKTASQIEDRDPVDVFTKMSRQMRVLDDRQKELVLNFIESFFAKLAEPSAEMHGSQRPASVGI